MSEVEFRRPRPRSQPEDAHPHAGLWWRIALGIFVGLLAHSVVTGLYVRWELYTGLRALGAAFDELGKDIGAATVTPAARPVARPVASTAPPRTSMRPLATDERCVGGKRFRRVENGWVQVLEPCR